MRKKLKFKIAAVCGLLAILIGLTGCANNNSNKITVVGSSAMQLLAEQAGNDYRLSHPDSNIVVQGGGSGTGLSQVQAGAVEIGTSDVFAETQKGIDAKKLQNHLVAVVGIVPIVNKSAGVSNLSKQQLSDIFTGKITNWKQVGGKNQTITVINRSKGSGTRGTFEGLVLNGKKPIQAQEQDSNGTVRKIVSSTPGTISYISFPYANDENIQKLKQREPNYKINQIESKEKVKEKEIKEEMDVVQGKIVIGLDLHLDNEEQKYSAMMYNAILGGTANSKMFQEVREKASLAYTAGSRYIRYKSNIFIKCGIEIKNYQKAMEIIRKQLEDMKNGIFTDEDIKNAKKGIISVIKSIDDEQDTQITYQFGHELTNIKTTEEEYTEKINKVTKEDIIKVAKSITVNTVYFLKNK